MNKSASRLSVRLLCVPVVEYAVLVFFTVELIVCLMDRLWKFNAGYGKYVM